MEVVEAVVVGGGHHGLVAACELADAGWDVAVVEARDEVGGAVSTRRIGDFLVDEFSACHPLAVVSPVLQALDLGAHGLSWAHADRPLAHVADPSRTGARIERDAAATAASLDADAPGDGDAWLALVAHYDRIKQPLLEAILTSWPPVAPAAALVARTGLRELPDLARFLLLPVDRMGRELFRGQAGRDLLAGNALHSDVAPTSPVSGMFGWLMSMLAQDVGFPSPVGGTRRLALALRSRAEAAGASIRTGVAVTGIRPQSRGALVTLADGSVLRARRAVLADTSAPDLYGRLLPNDHVPSAVRDRLAREFAWDLPTAKLNLCLDDPLPWRDPAAVGAGVVHLGLDGPGLVRHAAALESGTEPDGTFCLLGQMSTIDPTRSPVGTESVWLYGHLPRGCTDGAAAARLVERFEGLLDDHAPGWRALERDRWVQDPTSLESADANLGAGAVGGGTQQLFQQALWRPFTSLGGPRTVVPGVYLASAAIHPGGGVHGGCGHLAAQAALADTAWWGRPVGRAWSAANRRLAEPPSWLPRG